MHEREVCPKCSAAFAARETLVSGGVPIGFNVFTFSDVAVMVRCPDYRHTLSARTLELFEFLSANGLRWVVLTILVTGMVILVR